jgi:site-specific DNA-cytosine methylase
VLFLNSQFFGVPQSRNRGYWVFVHKSLPMPDLEHRPVSRCHHCAKDVEAVWTWKTGPTPTGTVEYGKQYNYRCPSCRREVVPPMTPSLAALDLTDLGTRLGDKPIKTFKDKKTGEIFRGPLARSSMERAERCRQRFATSPAILMPAKGVHGSERLLLQPMATQTSQQETAILSTGPVTQPLWAESAVALAVDNYQGAPRGAGEPLPTQVGSETLAVVSSGVVPYRKNTVPTLHGEAMPTFTSDQIPGLLTAAGTVAHGTAELQISALWQATLSELPLEDCFYRMMREYEIGRGCGFDVDFPGYKGTFRVWGSARNQVDGFGNAVSRQVGAWIGTRMRAVIHTPQDRGPELGVAA